MQANHTSTVKQLQAQIKEYYQRKVPFRIYHGSTNATRVMSFKRSEMVDTSKLDQVLAIDATRQTALVEPNVPMDKLLKATLKHGLMPPVVTEFPGITVGGAIQGGAIESGSFKWGAFSQNVNQVEMILANGDLVTASPKQNADLFYGAAGSYGSLGVITSAEITLIPAKKYVITTLLHTNSFEETVATVAKLQKSDYDFVECAITAKNNGIVIGGILSDKPEGEVARFTRAYDPWYYMYVKKHVRHDQPVTFSIPLKDYLFRYDRGAFSAAQLAFEQSGLPFNAFIRFALNPLLKTRKLYQALQSSAAGQKFICQDIVLPERSVVAFLDYMDKQYNAYPTGFCAVKTEPRSPLLFNGVADEDMVYNVAVYGLKVTPYKKFIAVNRDIEKITHTLGGRKWFYAHSYYSEKEFWNIYDKKWYQKLRQKYHALTLPDIYARIKVSEIYKVEARKAALKTAFGRAKIRISD